MTLADVLVAMALLDGRSAPGWSEVRLHVADAGHHDPDGLILDGLRDGDAFARLNDEDEWELRVRWPAARRVLLDYARTKLEQAGLTAEDFDTYEGDDERLVVSMGIELAYLDMDKEPPERPWVYRSLLGG